MTGERPLQLMRFSRTFRGDQAIFCPADPLPGRGGSRRPWRPRSSRPPVGSKRSDASLARVAVALRGPYGVSIDGGTD
jgi:hypothetical protein